MANLMTRIANMFGIGRVTGLDDSGDAQKIQYQTPLEVASAHRLLALGGLGAGFAGYFFHHKTRKWYFKLS